MWAKFHFKQIQQRLEMHMKFFFIGSSLWLTFNEEDAGEGYFCIGTMRIGDNY